MRRPKRRILLVGAGLLLLAIVAALLAWLTLTQSGLDRVVAVVESLAPAQVRIEGARGRLAGPLSIDRFEWRHKRFEVVALGIVADYEPSSLAWGSIGADSLAARQVSVRVKPKTAPDTTAPRFLPAWLTLGIDAVDVARADVTLPNGTLLPLTHVHGALRMTASRLEARNLAVDGGTWSVQGSATLRARTPLGLEGEVAFTAGRAREVRGMARGAGDLQALSLDGTLAAPLASTFAGRLLSLDHEPRWEARFGVTRLDAGKLARVDFLGALAGRIDGHGTFTDYTLQGNLEGDGLPPAGATVAIHAMLEPGQLRLDPATVTLPATGTRVSLAGTIGFDSPRQLVLDAEWDKLDWPLVGRVQVASRAGRLHLAGGPRYQFRVEGTAAPRGLPEIRAKATGTLDAAAVEVVRADLTGLGGRGTASGRLGFAGREWRLFTDLEDLDPGRIRRDLGGRVSFVLEGHGEGLDQRASWQAELRRLRGQFRRQPLSGHASIGHRPGLTTFDRTELAVGPASLAVQGRLGKDTRLDARLVAADLSRLLPELGGNLRADIEARSQPARRAGEPSLGLHLTVSGTDLRWHDYRAARIGADADIDLSDRDPSWVRIRTIGVDLAGRRLTSSRLSLDGTSRDHAVVLQVGFGEDAVELLGHGGLRWPTYALQVTGLVGRGPRVPDYALAGPFDLAARPDGVAVTPICLTKAQQRVCAQGTWSTAQAWQASLSAEGLPLSVLGLHLPGKPAYRGRLDVQAAIAGAPDRAWSATGVAEVTDATFSYRRASGRDELVSLGVARLDLAAIPERYLLRLRTEATESTFVEAEVTAPRLATSAMADLPIAGSVRALTRELGLVPLFVPDIDRAAGEMLADLHVGGTFGAPVISGELRLSGGELDFYQTNLRLRALAATATFTDNRLDLAASADAGKGGFTLAGKLAWQNAELSGDLALRGDRLLVADLPEARVVASPDLRFHFDASKAVVTGSVLVPEARIAPATITGAVLASGDERLVTAGAPPAPAARYLLESRLALTLGNDVRIDAFGLKGRLTGSLTASVGSRDVAIGTGEFKIASGKYTAYTKDLDVTRGRLLFAGGPLGDPGVDLRAQRDFPGYKAGVNVRGRLRRPEITFFSEPPLSQSEIASLLLMGRRLDSLGAGDSSQFTLNRNELAAQGGALLAGQLGRQVGLDDVAVETGPNDYASLVLGKFLSPRLYVSYGISLAEQINTLKLRYTVGDRWLLRLESGAASSLDAEYTIER